MFDGWKRRASSKIVRAGGVRRGYRRQVCFAALFIFSFRDNTATIACPEAQGDFGQQLPQQFATPRGQCGQHGAAGAWVVGGWGSRRQLWAGVVQYKVIDSPLQP